MLYFYVFMYIYLIILCIKFTLCMFTYPVVQNYVRLYRYKTARHIMTSFVSGNLLLRTVI